MVLYDANTPPLSVGSGVVDADATPIYEIEDNQIFQVSLYIPVKRFSLGGNLFSNKGNPAKNYMLKFLEQEYPRGEGVRKQASLLMMWNRNALQPDDVFIPLRTNAGWISPIFKR